MSIDLPFILKACFKSRKFFGVTGNSPRFILIRRRNTVVFKPIIFIFQNSWWKQNQENPGKNLREYQKPTNHVRKRMNHKLESTISLVPCIIRSHMY